MDAAGELTAERWLQAKVIVADALEADSATARTALVARRCDGDSGLRAEVESLLAQTTSVFDQCAEETSAPLRRDMVFTAGRRIGAYAIVRELGRGGMGAVYLAERADGEFEKQVALKVLKRGTDTDEVLRRFQAERQILARLDHPNLARLLDAGTTDDGLPYFVMDYVIGTPINEYVAAHDLSVTLRLKLFQAVCAAVSYAHQNLVIHRDIKPSNVLVTLEGEVKLLDFGIAKLVQETDADQPEVTVTMLRVMTPEYASPEQIRGEPVTTVSDVYSLGVFLYELLTGSRPYRLRDRTPGEMTKAICEQEPERPSTIITRASTGPDGSALRALSAPEGDASKLRRRLRGDLDNIILKALRKEPPRRYSSVDQLSGDIRRHLEGLPVRARRDSTTYRASKFVQRHKLGVAGAVILALALIGGIAATSWEAQQARRQSVIAEERFREVRELAHSVLFDYHDAILSLPGSTAVRERLVKDSLKYLDRLAQTAGNDLSLQQEMAVAYLKVGDVQGRPATANLGDAKGALDSYQKALVICEKMSALAPKNIAMLICLGNVHGRLGEINSLRGNPASAVEQHRQALARFEELSAAGPTDPQYQVALANAHRMLGAVLGLPTIANIGDTKGGLEHLRKAAAIFEAIPDHDASGAGNRYSELFLAFTTKKAIQENLASVYEELAGVLEVIGDKAEALESRQKSVTILELLHAGDPLYVPVRRNLAVAYGNVGGALLNAGEREKALARFQQALALFEGLATEDQNNLNARKDLALGYRNMGKVLADSKDTPGASSYYHKASDILESLVAKDQGNAFLQRHLAYTYLKISMLSSDSDDLSASAVQARQAISICENLIGADPKNSTARNTLALSYSQLGKSFGLLASETTLASEQKKNWLEAKSWYQKSLDLWKAMKANGTLSGADAAKPDEVASEVAKCEVVLSAIAREKTAP